MIVNYTITEIEHTLYLFPYAQIKLEEMEKEVKDNKESIKYYHYCFIVKITEFWLSQCSYDEMEVITMRFFKRKSYDFIAIQLGYKSHSSVIKKIKEIMKKISYLNY